MSRPSRAFPGALLLAVALAGCSGIQTPLDPAGDQAALSDVIWRTMLWVCGFMYLLVLGFLGWALWRARRRRGAEAPPAVGHTQAEPALERSLTGWAALIVLGLTGLTVASFIVDARLTREAPNPLHVKVTANQWWWEVEYSGQPSDRQVVTANELHLPAGRPARIELRANDVIHSFWVPNLSGKEDLIPGRVNRLTVTPRRVGVFRGQCAEFCGLQHAKMALDVEVQDPAAFEAWRAHQIQPAADPGTPSTLLGRQVFLGKACSLCHRIAGTDAGGVTGPDLTHLAARRTIAAGTLPNGRSALAAWIADPQGIKPGTTMPRVTLTAKELNALVDYLETLR